MQRPNEKSMAIAERTTNNNSAKMNERIFLVCDRCLWTVTCLNKKYLDELSEISEVELSCPSCKDDQLSSFPVMQNDSFTYTYSKIKGLKIRFGVKQVSHWVNPLTFLRSSSLINAYCAMCLSFVTIFWSIKSENIYSVVPLTWVNTWERGFTLLSSLLL